jgi:hypothetical protein
MEATVEEKMAQLLSDAAASGTSELAWIDEKVSKRSKAKQTERKVSESCLRWCLGLIPSSANQAVSRENANPEDICDGLSDDEEEVLSSIVELEDEEDAGSFLATQQKAEVDLSSQRTLLNELL